MASISIADGQRFVLHWTSRMSLLLIATRSHSPKLAALRVQLCSQADSSTAIERCSFLVPFALQFIGFIHCSLW